MIWECARGPLLKQKAPPDIVRIRLPGRLVETQKEGFLRAAVFKGMRNAGTDNEKLMPAAGHIAFHALTGLVIAEACDTATRQEHDVLYGTLMIVVSANRARQKAGKVNIAEQVFFDQAVGDRTQNKTVRTAHPTKNEIQIAVCGGRPGLSFITGRIMKNVGCAMRTAMKKNIASTLHRGMCPQPVSPVRGISNNGAHACPPQL